MQQVTLNIPTEKMPVFRQILQVLGTKENSNNSAAVVTGNFNRDLQTPAKFHPYYDWEFFMNELEYE
jgi:hypothetical protein